MLPEEAQVSLIIVIGRGHSGTRAMSHTLTRSDVYMGAELNGSGDLIPAQEMYEACRMVARHVVHLGGVGWDFSALHEMPIEPEFRRLVLSYLWSVLTSPAPRRGWKLPETTLVLPWIVRMFPEASYIYWVRDPRDAIAGRHLTDDLGDFGVPYTHTEGLRERRAISWKYQREIVKATAKPARWMEVRFEDFVLDQERALRRLELYLGFPLTRIEVRPESIGRWKTDTERLDFPFLAEEMQALGYA
jgi:hypothetical protein